MLSTIRQKPLALGSLSAIVFGIILIAFPSLSYTLINAFLAITGIKLNLESIISLLQNMWILNLIPKIVGAVIIGTILLRSRLQVNQSALKRQTLRFSVIGLLGLFIVCSVFVDVPVAKAQAVATTGYILDTPLPVADWYVGNYSGGNIFAINGSSWDNLMGGIGSTAWAAYTGNYTKVEELVLAATTSGTVYLKDVAWNYNLTIPPSVQVIECRGGLTRTFVSSASSQGSPYVISTDTVNSGYYLCQDSADRYVNSWSSTNLATTANQVYDSFSQPEGGQVVFKSGQIFYTDTTDWQNDIILITNNTDTILTGAEIIVTKGGDAPIAIGRYITSERIILENVTITGGIITAQNSLTNDACAGFAIPFTNSSIRHILIQDVVIQSQPNAGTNAHAAFAVENSAASDSSSIIEDVTIKNVHAYNSRYGFTFENVIVGAAPTCNDIKIIDSSAENVLIYGVRFNNFVGDNIVIEGCTFTNIGNYSVYALPTLSACYFAGTLGNFSNVKIIDNFISNSYRGILLNTCNLTNPSVSGNRITNTGTWGVGGSIDCTSTTGTLRYGVKITDNIITNSPFTGINLVYATDSAIIGNMISGCASSAIYSTQGANGAIYSGNTVESLDNTNPLINVNTLGLDSDVIISENIAYVHDTQKWLNTASNATVIVLNNHVNYPLRFTYSSLGSYRGNIVLPYNDTCIGGIALGSGVSSVNVYFSSPLKSIFGNSSYTATLPFRVTSAATTWNTSIWFSGFSESGYTINFGTSTPDANQKVTPEMKLVI